MRNVQVIDGALNCSYSIYKFTDEEFNLVFCGELQDIEFIEDALKRLGPDKLNDVFKNVWNRPVDKSKVNGIHGTLFYELYHKKDYYPTKRSDQMVTALGCVIA